jgi:outer membrane receptor protein involved in Fe transport
VRAGIYQARYSFVGYQTVTMTEVTILPDLRTRVDVSLESAAIELVGVEVRAERPLIRKDLAATAYSIGETRLEQLPVSSFQEVLALQPGTTVEGNVRGGKTNEVVYLVDGIPVQDALQGGVGIFMPRSSTAAMTIYTGGFDAEYGNAMSGVVNIITKGGTDRHAVGIRYERDSWMPERWYQQQDRLSELEVHAGGPFVGGGTYYFLTGNVVLSDTRWWQDFQKYFLSPISTVAGGFGKVEKIFENGSRIALQGLYSLREWRDYEFSWRFNLDGLPPRREESFRAAALLTYALSPARGQ